MDYIDLNGNLVKNKSGQDKLLALFYTTAVGRIVLKPLVMPCVSKLGGSLLSGRLSTVLIKGFIKNNNIDLSDYEKCEYTSFNDFFTRRIVEGRRPVQKGKKLVSPSDGKVTVYRVCDDLKLNIKNTCYHLSELLKSERLAGHYAGGYVYIIRLSVDDYHRYIYPVSGVKSSNYHIKGVFHTVNPIANDYYPIYKENTREYTVIKTKTEGYVLQMEVGALLVGKITNLDRNENLLVKCGDEKGYFEYGGSTIVVITDKRMPLPRQDLLTNTLRGYETKVLQGENLVD